jgi:hypothetical protein
MRFIAAVVALINEEHILKILKSIIKVYFALEDLVNIV